MLLRKNISRNYYYCDQDENSLGLCFKSMYLTLIVAIFTSNFIFSMFKSSHTYRNINISNQRTLVKNISKNPGEEHIKEPCYRTYQRTQLKNISKHPAKIHIKEPCQRTYQSTLQKYILKNPAKEGIKESC